MDAPKMAPRFWLAERGFENSREPCVCMDDPRGGDPLIIATLKAGDYWKNYLLTLIDAANAGMALCEEVMELKARLDREVASDAA